MLVMAIKSGHDASIAVVRDGRLLWCLESEKDTFPPYAKCQDRGFTDMVTGDQGYQHSSLRGLP